MKDRVFVGKDLEDALDQASELLGLGPEALRYVVLEGSGAPGSDEEVRIAVLAGSAGAASASAAPAEGGTHVAPASGASAEHRIRQLVAAVAKASEAEIDVRLEQRETRLRVELSGAGCEVLLEQGTETVKALEHLLYRACRPSLDGGRLSVHCEGYGERRDEELQELAEELAAEVREHRQQQTAPPLNAYERRIVHMALADEPGLRTFSHGEGVNRRLIIAPEEHTPQSGADEAP